MAVAAVPVGQDLAHQRERGRPRRCDSPTTLEKSKLSSASNLHASCCMRLLSARHAMQEFEPAVAPRQRALARTNRPWLLRLRSRMPPPPAVINAPIGRNSAAPRSVPSTKKVNDGVDAEREIGIVATNYRTPRRQNGCGGLGVETQEMVAIVHSPIHASTSRRRQRVEHRSCPVIVAGRDQTIISQRNIVWQWRR